ncbi:unnamed protein product [Callosobruchus maculatus]|uniref:Uncharacterized protein n=1 Tax=Callosobruchus maculatus TaxID=64391 RepID=A0A653D692_CALMS|nr:unnamed protein product [Callosobruchus maculatus]
MHEKKSATTIDENKQRRSSRDSKKSAKSEKSLRDSKRSAKSEKHPAEESVAGEEVPRTALSPLPEVSTPGSSRAATPEPSQHPPQPDQPPDTGAKEETTQESPPITPGAEEGKPEEELKTPSEIDPEKTDDGDSGKKPPPPVMTITQTNEDENKPTTSAAAGGEGKETTNTSQHFEEGFKQTFHGLKGPIKPQELSFSLSVLKNVKHKSSKGADGFDPGNDKIWKFYKRVKVKYEVN